ncbi:DUF1129 family protein [Lactobacillus delbrueckii]|uniref:DUF1129 family protein n=1 Tax=Lactobacillus delbrueckii TaxID=1584 RepID=UPI0021A5B2F2|nr:DUF1129 family protein [Lactobacillus delbrueckii]MCT3502572.1 DUF1129 family protein [Lactobacillus delbrueckii subsp. lactis]
MEDRSIENTDGTIRSLSNRHVQMIAIGGTIGTGLFLGAGTTISATGPSVIFIYAIMGLFFFFLLRALGEMLYFDSNSHTFVSFITRYLGKAAGRFAGWTYWIGILFACMAELTAVSTYVQYWLPGLPAWLIEVSVLGLLTLLNLTAAKLFGEAEDLTAPLLAKIIIAQEEGQTARRLFGLAPTDLARQLLHPKAEKKAESKWPYFSVVCLAFLAMFSILAGVYESIARGQLDPRRQIGWLTVLALALFMGWVVALYKDLVKAGIKRSHLQLWSIMSLIMTGALICLLRLPVIRNVNPALPAPVCFTIAAGAIVILVFLMRHFKISHIFFEERRKKAKQ